MRGTKFQKRIVAMQILSGVGVQVYPEQKVYGRHRVGSRESDMMHQRCMRYHRSILYCLLKFADRSGPCSLSDSSLSLYCSRLISKRLLGSLCIGSIPLLPSSPG